MNNQNTPANSTVALTKRYRGLLPRLEALFNHEIRGTIGAPLLQIELARRFQEREQATRVQQAVARCERGLNELQEWQERRERWLSCRARDSVSLLAPCSIDVALEDLALLLALFGKKLRVPVVSDIEPCAAAQAIEPAVRVGLLCACVATLDRFAELSDQAQQSVVTLDQDRSEEPSEVTSNLCLRFPESRPEDLQGAPLTEALHTMSTLIAVEWHPRHLRFVWPPRTT